MIKMTFGEFLASLMRNEIQVISDEEVKKEY